MYYCLINLEIRFLFLFLILIVVVIAAAHAVVVVDLSLIWRKNDEKQARDDGEAHSRVFQTKATATCYYLYYYYKSASQEYTSTLYSTPRKLLVLE